MKKTPERKKGMAAARLGMSTDSKDVPQTAQGGESITAQTSSSVLEDTKKAVTGRMPLTSERLVSSKHLKGRMSAAKITRMVKAISKTRKELSEKKAREVFEREYELKREDLQIRPDEAARQLWDYGRTRQGAEERIAGTEALVKELKAEAAAASRNQRETYDQYHRLCQEWRAEESKSRRKFSATFHQDWVREPLKLPDLPP